MNLGDQLDRIYSALDAALDAMWAKVDERAASDGLAAAIDLAEELTVDLPECTRARARLAELKRRAIALHRERLASSGELWGRRLLHARMLKRYGAPPPDLSAIERAATPRYVVRNDGGGGCRELDDAVGSAFVGGAGSVIEVAVRGAECRLDTQPSVTRERKEYTVHEMRTRKVEEKTCQHRMVRISRECRPGEPKHSTCYDMKMEKCPPATFRTEQYTAVVRREAEVEVRRITSSLSLRATLHLSSELNERESPVATSASVEEATWTLNGKQERTSTGGAPELRQLSVEGMAAKVARERDAFATEMARVLLARAAAAERAGKHEEAEDLHVRAAWVSRSVDAPTQSWLKSQYGLSSETSTKLLAGDGELEPTHSSLAYKLVVPPADKDAADGEKKIAQISKSRAVSTQYEAVVAQIRDSSPGGGARMAGLVGLRTDGGRPIGKDGFLVLGHIDLHVGMDSEKDFALDFDLSVVPEWKVWIIGFGPLLGVGANGFGSRDAPGLYVPLGLYGALGGEVSLWPRTSVWDAHLTFSHPFRFLQVKTISEFVDAENRGELRINIRGIGKDSTLGVAARYTDYQGRGAGMSGHLGYSF